jgi:hypothetical protein
MAVATIATDKRHLATPQGSPFFILGVNYNGYFDRAWQMWDGQLYDPALIAQDFQKAQQSGFNALRLFVQGGLSQDLARGNFTKLDQTLSLAQDHQLAVLLTFNDNHSLDLGRVGELDGKIAQRYRGVDTLLGFDLENEPVFYNLAAAIYPAGYTAPIQTSRLLDHYGERASRAEAIDLQRARRIPAHLSADQAYYYLNGLRLFLEYDRAINAFTQAGWGTLVDFMLAAEAEPWYVLIEVLDGTVESWLKARIDPVRATGNTHLLTLGWNWLHFAALPANRVLDFQSYHNYAALSLLGFKANLAHLQGLRAAFPHHPITFAEFGWSNQSGQSPATSRFLDPRLTVLYEAATYAYLRANAFAGGFKWMLNDLKSSSNPYEANFGVFQVGDKAKPIREVVRHFRANWPAPTQPANFNWVPESEAGFAYRSDLPGQLTIGGYLYQDQTVSWRGDGVAHCFITTANRELVVESQGGGLLSLVPWDLLPGWQKGREATLSRLLEGNQRSQQATFAPGQPVIFHLAAGVRYAIGMGATAPPPPPNGDPTIEPKAGEHVLLLGDFENYMESALAYIRRFSPDFTFAAAQAAGRWPYVSVIAPPDLIADEVLDQIRGMGAILVERVAGATPAETKTLLDDLARRGQRFVTTIPLIPPQEEPPPPGADPPPPDPVESYTIRPGDTLGKIAREIYGDARLWSLIFEANRDKIANPSLIRVGLTLTIPART